MTAVPIVRRSSLAGLAILLSVALLATACSSSKKSSASGNGGATSGGTTSQGAGSTGGSTTSGGTLVHVKDFAFSPSTITVSVGSAVTWEFDDSISHNVTASNNAFSSKDLNNGQKYTFTFSKAGTYSYMCTIHPSMKATVIAK